jgi:hypothetical protein
MLVSETNCLNLKEHQGALQPMIQEPSSLVPDSQGPTPEQEDKAISVLMEEYKTLRAEIILRIGNRMQILGFLTAGVALVVSYVSISRSIWGLGLFLPLMTLLAGFAYWRLHAFQTDRMSEHVAELEREINERARRVSNITGDLLTWESRQKERRMQAERGRLSRWRYRLTGWF